MKTFSLKKENIERQWYLVDASDKVLGRLSTKIADRIRGKDKPTSTPHGRRAVRRAHPKATSAVAPAHGMGRHRNLKRGEGREGI